MSGAAELSARAEAWMAGDPDPVARAELRALLEAGEFAELASRLEPLTFGTAGLRAAVGAGCGRMSLAVVIRAAWGIGRYLAATQPAAEQTVVIGFDARPTSRAFAEASAGVLLAQGFRVVGFSEPVATPLCAYLGRQLAAAATIVVTASHNPRPDNGYKVYGRDAVQITAPTDREIAQQIEQAPAAKAVPRVVVDFGGGGAATGTASSHERLELVRPDAQEGYFSALSAAIARTGSARQLSIVHSALHGVGSQPMLRTLADAGFTRVRSVAEQAAPDGTFPTTPFPNPEEPGTMDLALTTARRFGADLLLVSDPDADRLAAAARNGAELEILDGNQVGALLADFTLSRFAGDAPPIVLASVVSSPLVGELARKRGACFERTHTGFKWLWHAALELEAGGQGRFCFAYEEALGYSVFAAVRDKDGIAAGRALAELAAECAEQGQTLFDRLRELYAAHGLWASAARNVALRGSGGPARSDAILDALASRAPLALCGQSVVRRLDYRELTPPRPSFRGRASLLELELADGSLVFVRPSGTEPKLKLYGHARRVITQKDDLTATLAAARARAAQLLEELETNLPD